MSEVLDEYGWVLYSKHSCCGPLLHRYRSPQFPGLELNIYPKHGKFKVTYLRSSPKIPIQSIEKLDQTMKQLKQEYAPAT